jgi:hypothetical protein
MTAALEALRQSSQELRFVALESQEQDVQRTRST